MNPMKVSSNPALLSVLLATKTSYGFERGFKIQFTELIPPDFLENNLHDMNKRIFTSNWREFCVQILGNIPNIESSKNMMGTSVGHELRNP